MTDASKPLEIRKFNPGIFQSDEDVKKQFVVREDDLQRVLKALRRHDSVLVTGTRGSGKTMLLARVAAELRTDDELYPVRFMEESYEIMDWGDFWLETLFHLARETEVQEPDLSQELTDAHEDFASRLRGDDAKAKVLEVALGRTLVLMVENLQDLWPDADNSKANKIFRQKLRHVLQTEDQILLLGTATEEFDGSEQGLFQEHINLNPLETQDCKRLWKMVSGEEEAPARDSGRDGRVRDREIKPLEILTGGNPRLLVIVAQFARRRSLRDYLARAELMEELVGLIDEHTEYFRSHLQGLAKAERRVYLAVIDLWRPSTTPEIAARARMDVRAVSAMIGRLVRRKMVHAEKLYTAKDGSDRREEKEQIVYLAVVGLRRPSTVAEIADHVHRREGYREMSLDDISTVLGGLVRDKVVEVGKKRLYVAKEGLYSIYYKLRRQGHRERTKVTDLLRFMSVFYTDSEISYPSDESGRERGENRVTDLGGDYEMKEREVAKWLNKGVAPSGPGTEGSDVERYDELIERLGHSAAPSDQEQVAKAMVVKGVTLWRRKKFAREIEVYDRLVERYGDSDAPAVQEQVAKAMVYKGVTLWGRKEFRREIEVYDQLVERYGDSDAPAVQEQVAKALDNKGITLRRRDGATAEIAAYEELVTRLARSPALEIKEWVAEAQLRVDRLEDALRICDELDADKGLRLRAAFIRTRALFKQGNHGAAMEAFRSVYTDFRLGADDETTMRKMQTWLIELISAGVQQRRLLEILLMDKETAATLEPMIAALRKDMNLQVRVPAEVQEVANDIFDAIRNQRADDARKR